MPIITSLPRIVRFIDKHDSGEYGNDTCAHCGALGRYQFTFLCDDGKKHAAMAGCIKLFPVAPIAKVHAKLLDKLLSLRQRFGPDAHLNKWDQAKRDAIEDFYDGDKTEDEAMRIIHDQDLAAKDWRRKKGLKF